MSKLKGKPWTPEQLAKARATRLKNLQAKGQTIATRPDARESLKEVMVYLNHANKAFDQPPPRKGSSMLPPAQLYVQLALQTLQGRT